MIYINPRKATCATVGFYKDKSGTNWNWRGRTKQRLTSSRAIINVGFNSCSSFRVGNTTFATKAFTPLE